MDQRPQQNRGREPVQRPSQGTGGFQVKIDQRDLMTGSLEAPRQRRGQPVQYAEPPSAKKAALTDKELKAEKRAHKKRNRIKARKNKRVFSFVWLCMVLLTSFTLASYLIGGAMDFFGDGRDTGTVDITIPEGKLTEDGLAEILYQAGAIKKPEFFSLYCKVKEDMEDFQPGTSLEVGTDLDYEALINILQGGGEVDREVVTVVFPEGFNALEGARLLEENEVCTASEFLSALNTMDFSKYGMIGALGDTSNRYYKLEGYLFPDTYEFYKGEKLDSVIGKLLHNFQRKMDDKLLEKIQNSGMSMDQVVTLASIIQAEAASTKDMFDVSAVLHNRLEFGADYDIFNLECDSTAYYPYKNAKQMEEIGGNLSYGNYNTYNFSGLPAGPICNPGLEALNAALKPNTKGDASSYLYFCHSDDGVAYYATNEWDHEYNKQLAGLS
ncbi:endolytic transglycosylase MltG [Acutalibacter sp. 1XD8-33]|uniref:endolytic transglycosylase MltG n=1 Tax=Acutalibacter sp. 1XD8-33 TaxID=2320081 RepID=UPI000EA3B1E5|nr:endolytic transglycosylase MltG [Acutalibacter sp. 1XD8-33]RKJ41351.1 endolytic transglycosylase MltG [Acutalibacter sp. 1XD8-33]